MVYPASMSELEKIKQLGGGGVVLILSDIGKSEEYVVV